MSGTSGPKGLGPKRPIYLGAAATPPPAAKPSPLPPPPALPSPPPAARALPLPAGVRAPVYSERIREAMIGNLDYLRTIRAEVTAEKRQVAGTMYFGTLPSQAILDRPTGTELLTLHVTMDGAGRIRSFHCDGVVHSSHTDHIEGTRSVIEGEVFKPVECDITIDSQGVILAIDANLSGPTIEAKKSIMTSAQTTVLAGMIAISEGERRSSLMRDPFSFFIHHSNAVREGGRPNPGWMIRDIAEVLNGAIGVDQSKRPEHSTTIVFAEFAGALRAYNALDVNRPQEINIIGFLEVHPQRGLILLDSIASSSDPKMAAITEAVNYCSSRLGIFFAPEIRGAVITTSPTFTSDTGLLGQGEDVAIAKTVTLGGLEAAAGRSALSLVQDFEPSMPQDGFVNRVLVAYKLSSEIGSLSWHRGANEREVPTYRLPVDLDEVTVGRIVPASRRPSNHLGVTDLRKDSSVSEQHARFYRNPGHPNVWFVECVTEKGEVGVCRDEGVPGYRLTRNQGRQGWMQIQSGDTVYLTPDTPIRIEF